MKAIASYLLMLQKYINSKQKTQNKILFRVQTIFQKILQLKILKRKAGLKRIVKTFSIDFNPIDTNDVLDIHKYSIKRA